MYESPGAHFYEAFGADAILLGRVNPVPESFVMRLQAERFSISIALKSSLCKRCVIQFHGATECGDGLRLAH
jgi:hypothetical protein